MDLVGFLIRGWNLSFKIIGGWNLSGWKQSLTHRKGPLITPSAHMDLGRFRLDSIWVGNSRFTYRKGPLITTSAQID